MDDHVAAYGEILDALLTIQLDDQAFAERTPDDDAETLGWIGAEAGGEPVVEVFGVGGVLHGCIVLVL